MVIPLSAAQNEIPRTVADELYPLLPVESLNKLNSILNARVYQSLEDTALSATERLYRCSDTGHFHYLSFHQLNNQKNNQKNTSQAAKTVQTFLFHLHLCHGLQTPVPEKNSGATVHFDQLMSIENTLERIVGQPPYFFYGEMTLMAGIIIGMSTIGACE